MLGLPDGQVVQEQRQPVLNQADVVYFNHAFAALGQQSSDSLHVLGLLGLVDAVHFLGQSVEKGGELEVQQLGVQFALRDLDGVEDAGAIVGVSVQGLVLGRGWQVLDDEGAESLGEFEFVSVQFYWVQVYGRTTSWL